MIKNYKQFNESLRDKLVGPNEDEILDKLKDLSPNDMLHKSCKIGLLKGVELALEQGADIHNNNDNPICLSSAEGNTDVVKYLLDKGADIHVDGDWPLKYASYNGHTDTVKLLLDRGADINIIKSLINRVSINGHTETIELLKKYMEND